MEDRVVPMKDQNALVMGDGKVYKIQKVRQRKIHSCVPCHQRKVKCSREHPSCQNCLKNALECKYFVNDRVSRGKKATDMDKMTDKQKKLELKEYMAKAKIMVNSGSQLSTPQPEELLSSNDAQYTGSQSEVTSVHSRKYDEDNERKSSINNGSVIPEDAKEKALTFSDSASPSSNESLSPPKLHNPQTLPTGKSGSNLISSQQTQPSNSQYQSSQYSSSDSFQTPSNQTQLPQTQSSYNNYPSSLFDSNPPAFGSSILSDFRSTPQPPPLPTRTQYNDYSLPSVTQQPLPSTANGLNLSLPVILLPKQADQIPVQKLEEIFSALPTKERSFGLVKRYIKVIHPVLPILDIKEFQEQHELFWENNLSNKLEFISLLLTVLYAASKAECFEFSYDEITKFELSNEIHKYLRVARVALTAINYPQVYSLRVLQGAVILQSTLENPSLIDVSILVRIAQMIKLHRDPANYHNITDPSLVQLRRLLWWQIFYLDSMTSLKQLSTPIIRLDEFDTSLPVEYTKNTLYHEICFLNGKFRFSLILNELIRFIYGISNLTYNTIQVLKQKILDLHISCNASILNLENYEKSRELNYDESTFISWSKSVLNSYCDRALLLLQKKIILANVLNTNDDGNNQIYHSSYNLMVNNIKSQFSIDSYNNGEVSRYTYDDLSSNLISASLHYLYEFLKNNNDDIYNGFNWEIRNNLPFDAITLLLTNLISDLKKNLNENNNKIYELRNDIRYHILDKSIDLIFIKFDNKKRSIIKNCFTLIRYLFQILRLKYLRNDNNSNLIEFDTYYTEQAIPKPINSSSSFRDSSSILPTPLQTTSCSQIAPRAMRALAGSNGSISFSKPSSNLNGLSLSDMFVNGLTSDVQFLSPSNTVSNTSSTMMNTNSVNDPSVDESYKEHELQRIKSQITKFIREERLSDDDPFNNKFYIMIESEVKELIESLI